MLVGRDLGLPNLVVLVVVFVIFPAIGFVIRRKLQHAAARSEEIRRLLVLTSEEAARAEIEATEGYFYTTNTSSSVRSPDSAWIPPTLSVPVVSSLKPPFQCAVCFSPTHTRCAKCKAVRYCSGRCQIVHWRQGHKDECRPYVSVKPFIESPDSSIKQEDSKDFNDNLSDKNQPEIRPAFQSSSESSSEEYSTFSTPSRSSTEDSPGRSGDSTDQNKSNHSDEDVEPRFSTSSSSADDRSNGSSFSDPSKTGFWSGTIHSKKSIIDELDGFESSGSNEVANEKMTNSSTMKRVTINSNIMDESGSVDLGRKKSNDEISLSNEKLVDDLKSMRPPKYTSEISNVRETKVSPSGGMPSAILEKSTHVVNNKNVTSPALKNSVTTCSSKPTENYASAGIELRTSMLKVADQVKPSKLTAHKYGCKGLFSYDMFVKLYNWKRIELRPFGLMNCGNSCYANAVLQCLTYTPPLNAYLLQGLHSKACDKRDWCFTCEFEGLVLKAKNGNSTLSPIRILSQIETIGSNLGHGKEEDAHEFLRYAIDALQLVCLKETGTNASNSSEEETTLIALTFGGYLRSQIKCMKCGVKSERHERMMDLTVEIEGDIGTLEEALNKFTRTEILDGENKYKCSRCKSYEKAKKKLTLLEAPNVLTIALKRFQSGKFGKLNKPIHFPEILDMAPYVSGTSDKSPVYRLYGVVVHVDVMNSAFSGHYVCYVKNLDNRWFMIDDSRVNEVGVQSVLTKGAYMLLYARCSPRAPRSIRTLLYNHDPKKHKTTPSFTSKPHSTEPWRMNHNHLPIRHRTLDESSSSSSEGSGIFSSESCSCSTEDNNNNISWDWNDHNTHMNSSDSDTSSSSSSSSSSSPSPLYSTHSDLYTLRERSRSCKVGPGVLYDDECRKLSCSNSCRVDRLGGRPINGLRRSE